MGVGEGLELADVEFLELAGEVANGGFCDHGRETSDGCDGVGGTSMCV